MSDIKASPGYQHEKFTIWVKQQGVKVNSVEPGSFPGRGLGIIAQHKIEVTHPTVMLPTLGLR